MVERFNRTLAEMLTKETCLGCRDWELRLPYVLMAYRTSVHSSTGYIPARLMFGHELALPLDLAMPRIPGEKNSNSCGKG
jgi:hypothetical protein